VTLPTRQTSRKGRTIARFPASKFQPLACRQRMP